MDALKQQAYREYHAALHAGTLVRQPCEVCGNPKSDGHHRDYTKPLEVVWLCSVHHVEEHRRIKAAKRQAEYVAANCGSSLSVRQTAKLLGIPREQVHQMLDTRGLLACPGRQKRIAGWTVEAQLAMVGA